MEEQRKESGQMKALLVRVWEILRGAGKDRPLSLDEIRQLLLEEDSKSGEEAEGEKYSARLLSANIKAINAALELPPPLFSADNRPCPERAALILKKVAKQAETSGQPSAADRIERICVGRHQEKEWLYYHRDALTDDELHFLLDAVRSAAFLPAQRAEELCKKLGRLLGGVDTSTWKNRAAKVSTSLYINEDVFETLRTAEEAIEQERELSFVYCAGFGRDKRPLWESWIKPQSIEPIAVLYHGGLYYLYGYDPLKNYYRMLRIDRMTKVKIAKTPSPHTKERETLLGGESDFTEHMAAFPPCPEGKAVEVDFRVRSGRMSEMFEKFGAEIRPLIDFRDSSFYTFSQTVNISPAFFGWCALFGGDLQITSPAWLRAEYAKYFMRLLRRDFSTDELKAAQNALSPIK